MSFLRPYTTLAIGMVLGVLVVPKVARKLNINLPG